MEVSLLSGLWQPKHSITTDTNGTWLLTDHVTGVMRPAGPGADNFEVAVLVVENPGRIAVTITSPSLQVRREGARFVFRRWSPKGYSVGPRMFAAPGLGEHIPKTETVVRIEPYDRVTFLLDYWTALPHDRQQRVGPVRIRGRVTVPGKRRPRLSSRRRAWCIPKHAWTARQGNPPLAVTTVLWRALYRASLLPPEAVPFGLNKDLALEAVLETVTEFDEEPAFEELKAVFSRVSASLAVDQRPSTHLARTLKEALDADRGHLAAWPSSR